MLRRGVILLVCLFFCRNMFGESRPTHFQSSGGQRSSADFEHLKPIPQLGTDKYQGFQGGLYPGGTNDRPAGHESAGMQLARSVRPLDRAGRPSAEGKIVLLSIGMSNATQEFSAFKRLADSDDEKNPQLVIVDGAQGGMTAAVIRDPESDRGSQFWQTVADRLENAGVTPDQVQAVWIKQANAAPSQGFPKYAQQLEQDLAEVVRVLHQRFTNLKLAYLSCRTYGGYATTRLNPEPYAYESGFAIKWLIERQIEGDERVNFDEERGAVRAPWLSWGPYIWANGERPNADGLAYEPSDFVGDGTHPSPSGRRKVAQQLVRFFKTDSTTRPWFLAGRRASDRSGAEAGPAAREERRGAVCTVAVWNATECLIDVSPDHDAQPPISPTEY